MMPTAFWRLESRFTHFSESTNSMTLDQLIALLGSPATLATAVLIRESRSSLQGREFPFVMLALQCPRHLRWPSDEWFENFYKEATARYRIDSGRVYLTGPSLGGSGTWDIAARYPEMFAAIAPMSGFNTSHFDYAHTCRT